MLEFLAKKFRCPLVKVIVIITRHRYCFLGGVGDPSCYEQLNYKCSIEEDCPHSMHSSCRVRKLSEQ